MPDSSYTVQMQTVHIRKKKQTYVDSYTTEAPDGYFFLPIGFRNMKDQCRAICLESSTQYYVVNIYPKLGQKGLKMTITGNIYRFGWHFPTSVILNAMQLLGLHTQAAVTSCRNMLAEAADMDSPYCTQQNLKELCLELFPKIPETDVDSILHHAFERGSGRVGDAQIPFPRRMQLAVLAHIRHVHTQYDSLLKIKPRQMARRLIEPTCLRILIKWRGEDSEVELEERDEEVIIIEDSDDETSEDELDTYGPSAIRTEWQQGRGSPDVQVVSWKQNGRDIQVYAQDLPDRFYNPSFDQFVDLTQSHPAVYSYHQSPHHTPIKMENLKPNYPNSLQQPTHYGYQPTTARATGRIGNNYANPIVLEDSPYHVPHAYPSRAPPTHGLGSPTQRPQTQYPEPPGSQKSMIVYDKFGRPYHLIGDQTIPVGESQDAVLPSIERDRDSRPSSAYQPPPADMSPRNIQSPHQHHVRRPSELYPPPPTNSSPRYASSLQSHQYPGSTQPLNPYRPPLPPQYSDHSYTETPAHPQPVTTTTPPRYTDQSSGYWGNQGYR